MIRLESPIAREEGGIAALIFSQKLNHSEKSIFPMFANSIFFRKFVKWITSRYKTLDR